MLKPLIRWPGGQYHTAKRLVAAMPAHEVFVEPFAGGLSVFWNKTPASTEIVGDMNEHLIRFYDSVRRGKLDGCKPVRQSEASFTAAKSAFKKNPCAFFSLNKMAYDGSTEESRSVMNEGKVLGSQALAKLGTYVARLRKTTLIIGDFEAVMRKHDSPETLHFLDPPWNKDAMSAQYAKTKYGKKHAGVTLERVADVAASMEGKILMIYQDSPEARKVLRSRGFKLYRMPAGGRRLGQEGSREKASRIVAANFDVAAVVKARRRR